MSKPRNILGTITGVILIVSSVVHSFLGWKSGREQLIAAGTPDELIFSLGAGWVFAGLAMLVFGVLLLLTFVPRMREMYRPLTTARIIGYAYAAFGLAAYGLSKSMFFISLFFVPAVLILIASSERDEE